MAFSWVVLAGSEHATRVMGPRVSVRCEADAASQVPVNWLQPVVPDTVLPSTSNTSAAADTAATSLPSVVTLASVQLVPPNVADEPAAVVADDESSSLPQPH